MDMLYISNLYKRFSDKKVLNGLNLSVPEHSIFGFIGKNGAGKNNDDENGTRTLKSGCR